MHIRTFLFEHLIQKKSKPRDVQTATHKVQTITYPSPLNWFKLQYLNQI